MSDASRDGTAEEAAVIERSLRDKIQRVANELDDATVLHTELATLRAENERLRARVAELEALLVEIANGPGAGCVGVDKYNQPWATCPCGAEKGYRMSVASLVKHCPQCSHDRPGPGEGSDG